MKPIQTITLNPAFDIHYGMDSFEARKENYVKSAVIQAGGKGINISRALTENGISNIAYVALARENAATFEQELQKDGLAYVPFYTSGRIRENITLHPANDRETRISLDTFYADQAILDAMEEALRKEELSDSLLAFSGRLPRGIEKSAVIAFLKRLIARGARVVVDSNSFSADDLRKIHPWFIKPNEQEIAAFLGRTVSDAKDGAEAAMELVKQGVAEEVISGTASPRKPRSKRGEMATPAPTVAKVRSINTRAAIAGFTMFLPSPPKMHLTTTIAKIEPRAACQSSTFVERLSARSRPVTTALKSPTV